MKRIKFLLLVLFIFGLMSSVPEEPESLPELNKVSRKGNVLKTPTEERVYYGQASYYGERWNGRTTANMEIYDCDLLTCASPTLPFDTIIKVTNIDTEEFIIIRVNDRGPYKMDAEGKALRPLIPHPVRVLDLSRESFKSIGDLKEGIINIKYEIVG